MWGLHLILCIGLDLIFPLGPVRSSNLSSLVNLHLESVLYFFQFLLALLSGDSLRVLEQCSMDENNRLGENIGCGSGMPHTTTHNGRGGKGLRTRVSQNHRHIAGDYVKPLLPPPPTRLLFKPPKCQAKGGQEPKNRGPIF